MTFRKAFDGALVALNIVVLAGVAYLAFREGGFGRTALQHWRHERALRASVNRLWPELVDAGSILGSHDAAPAIIEFSDYQCPYCLTLHDSLLRVVDGGTSPGRVIVRHLPMSYHPLAVAAAAAAICAEAQGRFAAMDRRLFESSVWKSDSNWVREARAAGVPDIELFVRCLRSDLPGARIRMDVALAESVGVRGTPTLVSRFGRTVGVVSASQLYALLGTTAVR